jgi:hypothetical protein
MLNELHKLAETLAENNIVAIKWCDGYEKLSNYNFHRVWINDDGSIADVEVMDSQLKDVCRNYAPDNHNSFPALDVSKKKKFARCLEWSIPGIGDSNAFGMLKKIAATMNEDTFLSELSVKLDMPTLKKPLWVFLDLKNWDTFGYPVASEYTIGVVNSELCAAAQPKGNGALITDAFNVVCRMSEVNRLMAGSSLPGLGKMKLRSLNKDIECQARYRKIGSDTFPIGEDNRAAAMQALNWVSDRNRKDVTWTYAGEKSILLAYPDKLPATPIALTPLMTGIGNDSRFKSITSKFISAMRGLPPEQKPKSIQFFILRKIDKARTKVEYSRNLTVEGLINAAQEWQSGCANLPDMSPFGSSTPFPLDVSETANKVWKQDGTRADGKKSVKLMRYYQGIELLLDAPYESQILRILRGLIVNTSGLVQFIGNNPPRGRGAVKDTIKEEAGTLFPLFGLLLYKSGIIKEDYMENSAYLLGQLLKISDGLHELYCEVKRDGDVPPQLAGNSVFVTASETPLRAFALLGTRMSPYISWAKQYITLRDNAGEHLPERGFAIWYMRMYEDVMTKLTELLPETTKFSDYEKAQLFIGYLAAFPKRAGQNIEQEETNIE